ncbi:MAG: efflux RND transporter periplasmic adaptor subunit [Clostridiales bacterium]|nr:efflux RND transporter periplasmic adaptor subunit [Clostridiales bacterium]MCF8023217.1 efflux RND transporter periplasmic adaptor subunit [Clostridiales bacterium]
MKKIIILFFLISLLGAGGCGGKEEAGTPEEKSKIDVTYVKVGAAGTADFTNSLSLPGVLKPYKKVVITSSVNGTVDSVHADIGDRVQAGELLCKLDDSTFSIQHDQAKTALNLQQISFDDAEKNYQRRKQLYEKDVISKVEFEAAEKQYKMAEEQLKNAEYSYDLATKNLNDTSITSPIKGTVGFKDVSTGENIGPSRPLFKVVRTNPMYIETGVAEKNIGDIKKGQTVLINVDSIGGKQLEGKVTHIGPVPGQQNNTYPIKILVQNDGRLKPGMVAVINVVIAEHKDALVVPQKAIINENNKDYVFIVENGKAVKKEVKTGLTKPGVSVDRVCEIIEGLEKGEKVVFVGNDGLKDGSPVETR